MATPTFKRLTLDQFARLLLQFPFTRQINAVHMHHTWRPRQRDFRGHDSIVAMWRYHTQTNGWSDIAQHITIDPEGFIWLGRNWNRAPVSATGHNGSSSYGPFMFEMVGDFDRGGDTFGGAQRDTTLQVIAMLQERFGLPLDSLVFHSAMSGKTCPGNSIDREQLLAEVQNLRNQGVLLGGSRSLDVTSDDPFPQEEDQAVQSAISALESRTAGNDPADAELSYEEPAAQAISSASSNTLAPLGSTALTPARLAALRPHLLNLSLGSFSDTGRLKTRASDVDAIFEQHLPAALAEAQAAGRKLKIVLQASAGLYSETAELALLEKQIGWWRSNDVYPLCFLWESGICAQIASVLQRAAEGATQGLSALLTDPLIETTAATLGARTLWSGIKYSAERASSEDACGAAWQVASRLQALCAANPDSIELHGVAHSAGAIFFSHFLRSAHEQGVPRLHSLQLLAPAVRIDLFRQQIGDLLAAGEVASHTTLYSMSRDFEQADDCAGLYRKSMLYLLQNALEEREQAPLLGLEDSLRSDSAMKQLFGLDGRSGAAGEVIWACTASDSGRSASRAISHGGFADDPATFNSLLLRVLDLPDAASINGYPLDNPAGNPWVSQIDWPEEVMQQRGFFSSLFSGLFGGNAAITPGKIPSLPPAPASTTPSKPPSTLPSTGGVPGIVMPMPGVPQSNPVVPSTPTVTTPVVTAPVISAPTGSTSSTGGRKLALCIGINEYPNPQNRLYGCVADAQMWASSLSRLGFTCTQLLDGQATRANIDAQLRRLVSSARSGDVLVVMYSGHGTHVNDLNGDEDDGQDEALCPVDFASGALYIDDDVAKALAGLPAGVNLTLFMDCCHSGTNTRFASAGNDGLPPLPADARRRYVVPDEQLNQAHAAFRRQLDSLGDSQARPVSSGGEMRHVKFAACRDSEVAWESNGHGEFTLRATALLDRNPAMTNQQFLDQVISAFGSAPRQHPLLDCSSSSRNLQILKPIAAATRSLDGLDAQDLASTLQQMQQLLALLGYRQ